MTVINKQVSAGADDADHIVFGSFNSTFVWTRPQSNALSTQRSNAGYRFTNILLDASVTLNSVYWSGWFARTDHRWVGTVHFELIGDSPDFVTNADLNNRTLTSGVTWDTGLTPGGSFLQSPDLKVPFAEVLALPAWASGNAVMVALISSDAVDETTPLVNAYERDTLLAAKLDIDFSTGPTFNPAAYYLANQ